MSDLFYAQRPVTLQSIYIPGNWAYVNAPDLHAFDPKGSGVVGVTTDSSTQAIQFNIKPAQGAYVFESAAFPNVLLRMNATQVHSREQVGKAVVNCQYWDNTDPRQELRLERFNIIPVGDPNNGVVIIQSCDNPKVFLRMQAGFPQEVNAQYYERPSEAQDYEKFKLW